MSKKARSDQDLRAQAFALIDEGWTSDEVGELLEIKKMTVAGWLSWRTRGHYSHEEAYCGDAHVH